MNMGGCRKIAELFGAYIYGDLTPEEMRRVRLHTEECQTCHQELEARTRAVALIPNNLPTLSDEERLRIMWTVKGAVRARREPAPVRLFSPGFVQGFAVAAAIVAAFAAGTIFALRSRPPRERVVIKPAPVEQRATPPDSVADRPSKPSTNTSSTPSASTLAAGPRRRDRAPEIWRHGHDRSSRSAPKLSPAPGGEEIGEPKPETLKSEEPSGLLEPKPQMPPAPEAEGQTDVPDAPAPDVGPISTPPKTQPE